MLSAFPSVLKCQNGFRYFIAASEMFLSDLTFLALGFAPFFAGYAAFLAAMVCSSSDFVNYANDGSPRYREKRGPGLLPEVVEKSATPRAGGGKAINV